jgi:hypothetical protein
VDDPTVDITVALPDRSGPREFFRSGEIRCYSLGDDSRESPIGSRLDAAGVIRRQ